MTSTSRQLALATAAHAQTPSGGGRGQCWECQRRRLVCDSARPVCGKCKAGGVVCPGYDNKKPLTWLAPNKVKARTWKRKGAPTGQGPTVDEALKGANVEYGKTAGGEQLFHIFPGHKFRTETCDIVEATLYWNEQVYPFFASTQLTQSPWIIPIFYLHYMKPCTLHALTAMAIEHRMIRMSHRRHDPYMTEVRARAFQHRSTAVQALNKDIEGERTKTSDFTMSSVIVFLYGDLMGSATASNWRFHLNGFAALVALRGGWEAACRKSTHYKVLILFSKIVENLANTTSPAHDQMSPVYNFEMRELMSDMFTTGYYPNLPCPVELFIHITHINCLRFLATRPARGDAASSNKSEAEDLLKEIIGFSPEAWSETKDESRVEFLMMGQVYQSAVVLYGISSLESAGALPRSAGWAAVKAIHYGRLLSLLEKSATSRVLKSCIMWPMIVAGFEAKTASPATRAAILSRLTEESHELGVYLPLAVKEVLERFYASSGKSWDDCFDSPRALIT